MHYQKKKKKEMAHGYFIGIGVMFLALEMFLGAWWFGMIVYFNITPAAQPLEQTLFDLVFRVIGILGILHAINRAKKEKHMSWSINFVIWVAAFVAARAVIQTWRTTPNNVYEWGFLVATVVWAMVLSGLEVIWITGTSMWLNWKILKNLFYVRLIVSINPDLMNPTKKSRASAPREDLLDIEMNKSDINEDIDEEQQPMYSAVSNDSTKSSRLINRGK